MSQRSLLCRTTPSLSRVGLNLRISVYCSLKNCPQGKPDSLLHNFDKFSII